MSPAGLVLALLLLAPAALADCPAPAEAPRQVARVLDDVNARRGQHGLAPVAVSDALVRAAVHQACHMARSGRMSHEGAKGARLPARLRKVGYRYRAAAENVAFGHRDAGRVVAGWMASDGHRRNILMPSATQAGAAMRQGQNGRPYWALILAHPR